MLKGVVHGIKIAGIASAVSERSEGEKELASTFGNSAARRLILGTGVEERRCDVQFCASDYCEAAARRLLLELDWDPASVSHLIFVTQTPDYRLPSNAALMQHKLGLSTSCAAFDISLGCSGYTYGMWVLSRLLSTGERGLLLVGDTLTKTLSPLDRSMVPLIGDGGSATALECCPTSPDSSTIHYTCGTDGSGSGSIIIEAGGYRYPADATTGEKLPGPDKNLRSKEDLYMNGADVFTFALREVPSLVAGSCELAGWPLESVDKFVLHQANGFMLVTLANKMGIPKDKLPVSLERFGNSGSPTIPITLTTQLRDSLQISQQRLVLAGFGVGLSWSAVALTMGPMTVPPLIELPNCKNN